MKKIKIFLSFIMFVSILLIAEKVQANSIQSIEMDIYVDSNGDAQVTEIWNCKANSGTEIYHPYYNLGKSHILGLEVSKDGEAYTSYSSWDTSKSFSEKAYKCGINKISNGVELCWGISEYGQNVYTVKYEITNFVSTLTDSQMIYWTLIPYSFSNTIGRAYIKIYTDFDISDTTDVWGYGDYGGTAYVYDGYIEMESNGSLATSDYMTILVKFPLDTFNATNTLKHDFDYYYEMAEEGSTKYNGKSNKSVSSVLYFIFYFIFVYVFPFIFVAIIRKISKKQSAISNVKIQKISSNIGYCRDIPCNNDIYRTYYISQVYHLASNKTDILGAIILKWLKDSVIRLEQKEVGVIFKKEDTVIVLNETNPDVIENENERKLFYMLLRASKDGILEDKEFEKWCSNSYTSVLNWFDKVIKEEEKKLVAEGLINAEEKMTLGIFKEIRYSETPELRKMAEDIAGLKKYLQNYTLIGERSAIEVHLFEEYLIVAQILGIAKEVAKEFKDLYPEVIEKSNFGSYDYIIYVNHYASRGVSIAHSARSRAESRASSYSSGGGGFSSGGGGGGSFGGGGGGGGFR